MKRIIILAVMVLSVFLVGCQSQPEENIELVEDGRIALEKKEYEEAMKILSDILDVDPTNEDARAMYIQATRMLNVKSYEEQENYKKAIKELEFIENMKGGSSVVRDDASDKRKELEKLYDEYEAAREQRRLNAKRVANSDQSRVEQDALDEYEEQLRQEAGESSGEDAESDQEEVEVEVEDNSPDQEA